MTLQEVLDMVAPGYLRELFSSGEFLSKIREGLETSFDTGRGHWFLTYKFVGNGAIHTRLYREGTDEAMIIGGDSRIRTNFGETSYLLLVTYFHPDTPEVVDDFGGAFPCPAYFPCSYAEGANARVGISSSTIYNIIVGPRSMSFVSRAFPMADAEVQEVFPYASDSPFSSHYVDYFKRHGISQAEHYAAMAEEPPRVKALTTDVKAISYALIRRLQETGHYKTAALNLMPDGSVSQDDLSKLDQFAFEVRKHLPKKVS